MNSEITERTACKREIRSSPTKSASIRFRECDNGASNFALQATSLAPMDPETSATKTTCSGCPGVLETLSGPELRIRGTRRPPTIREGGTPFPPICSFFPGGLWPHDSDSVFGFSEEGATAGGNIERPCEASETPLACCTMEPKADNLCLQECRAAGRGDACTIVEEMRRAPVVMAS
mmetsp:Transcript_131868/g.246612  ORF Transcript_131868/g.246612 Transcript_131868/m.246612 type:complete len:177 (+) Transcript_131868:1752-2282(+)